MKILQLLSLLNDTEISLLKKFIVSPIYNTKEDVVLYIKGSINFVKNKHLDIANFDDTYLYASIYPNIPFSRHKLWKLRSKSTELLEEFIVFLMQQKENKIFYSISFFQERKAFALAEKKIQDAEAIIDNTKDKRIAYYDEVYDLYKHNYQLQQQSRSISLNLDLPLMVVNSHEKSFALTHAIYLISLVAADIANTQYPKISTFLNWVESIDYAKDEIIVLYINLLLLMTETDAKKKDLFYSKITASFLNIKNKLCTRDRYNIIICVINSCTSRSSKTNHSPLKEAFVWWQYLLTDDEINNLFLLHSFNMSNYSNIIQLAILIKEFEFAQNFITQYSPRLPDDTGRQYVLYYTALLSFYQKKYDDVHCLLIELENLSQNVDIIKIQSYILWIKLYYEEENYNLLESYINRLRVFNTRHHTLSDAYIKAINGFVVIANKLLKIKYIKQVSNINPSKIEELLISINSLTLVPLDYIWLISKTGELYDLKKQKQFS